MAFPTAVNDEITDSVTQSNVEVLGDAAAMALGSLYQTTAHSTGLMLGNAVTQQNSAATISQTATASIVSFILSQASNR